MPGALRAGACPGREASPAYSPQTQCPTAFLEGGITFDSKEHLGSGARGLQPGYTDSAPVLFTPVSGVGGGCLRVSLPRVSELEETSGSLCPPEGCPSLTQVYCLRGKAECPPPPPSFFGLFDLQVLEATVSSGPLPNDGD